MPQFRDRLLRLGATLWESKYFLSINFTANVLMHIIFHATLLCCAPGGNLMGIYLTTRVF